MIESHNRKSFVILVFDGVQNSSEIIAAFVIYSLLGGVSWIGWGLDSVGELVTTLVLLFYVRNIKVSTLEHDHEAHMRERKASRYIAYSFFGLAAFTFLWALAIGEEPMPEQIIWWPKLVVGISIGFTAILALLKSRQSTGHHDPMHGGALQSWMCVISGFIAGAADFFHHWWRGSHFAGDILITCLLIYGGYKTYTSKRLCVH